MGAAWARHAMCESVLTVTSVVSADQHATSFLCPAKMKFDVAFKISGNNVIVYELGVLNPKVLWG
jgi:hypothetical protein